MCWCNDGRPSFEPCTRQACPYACGDTVSHSFNKKGGYIEQVGDVELSTPMSIEFVKVADEQSSRVRSLNRQNWSSLDNSCSVGPFMKVDTVPKDILGFLGLRKLFLQDPNQSNLRLNRGQRCNPKSAENRNKERKSLE